MAEKKVVYYPGCFVNYFEHETGKSVIEIMEKNGLEVVVPQHACCGLTLYYSGDLSYARFRAYNLVNILSPFVEQGYDIVVSCPTCCYSLKEVYPFLLADKQTMAIAQRTTFISQYLLKLYSEKKLSTDFRPMSQSVVYHAPCHLRSQNLSIESAKLMALVPETSIMVIDRGCCGMGGTWGMHSKFQGKVSAIIGSELFNAIVEAAPQVVATDCAGCQMHIASHINRRVIHPVRFLAEAYQPLYK